MILHLVLSAILLPIVLSKNVLFMSYIPSPSHHIWNSFLAHEMARRGHNVTMLSPDKDKGSSPANYTLIQVEGIYDNLHDEFDLSSIIDMNIYDAYFNIMVIWCEFACDKVINSKEFDYLWNYPKDFKFDLIVNDIALGGCLNPLIQRFGYPPTVGLTAWLLPSAVSHMMGNHLHPGYIPWHSLPYTPEMSFTQRVLNSIFTVVDAFYMYSGRKFSKNVIHKRFGDTIDPLDQIDRHVSLVLSNTDPVLVYPQPLTPNIIPVGGIHTKRPGEIPKEFLGILDKAKNGVIVFSLGTNIEVSELHAEKVAALMGAFEQLPHTIIMKYDAKDRNLPKNIIARKWIPQNSLLTHPNVKLFIGHGGALSSQEAIYHGMPFVAIPFFTDQNVNTNIMVNKKIALKIDYLTMTTESILKTIKEALGNPMYAKNMKTTSELYKDQLESPLERAIFWMEYVMRHKGAPHLSTAARDLPFYVAYSVDVALFLSSLVALSIFLIYKVIKRVVGVFSSKKRKIKTN